MNFKEYQDKLLFIPLGGANEIGVNVNLYHYDGKWIMMDCGSGFTDLPGADMLVADMDFIIQRKKNLVALILTHAHEDHIGAVQFFIQELGCPIYTTQFTANFLNRRLSEYRLNEKIDLRVVKSGSTHKIDPFEIELIGLTHSAPEMQALVLKTPEGNVLHTGDWKFDDDPVVGPVSDFKHLAKSGDEGIAALVCDSTNVFYKDKSGSEGDLRKSLVDIIAGCTKMVVVTTFASNLARLDSLIYAAKKAGRKVVLAGRSMHRMVAAAQDSGYLVDAGEFIDERDFGRFKRNEIMVIATGCQGEPLAAVSKVANGIQPNIKVSKGDTVIFSSKIIPGNEKKIFNMFNIFVRMGVDVITERDHFVHVSGHPSLAELKEMYHIVNPTAVIPVHGEPVHIHEHAKFARSVGIKQTVEVENGTVVMINKYESKIVGKVPTGYLAIDGNSLVSTDSAVFRARKRIQESGIMVITLVLDRHEKLMFKPIIDCPGVLDMSEDQDLLMDIVAGIQALFARGKSGGKKDGIETEIRSYVKSFVKAELGKMPLIIVNVKYIENK